MIRITYGKPYGDETFEYIIETNCKTVDDFIREWLCSCPNEWGYFGIKSKNNVFFGKPNCEYKHGRIITEPIPSEFLNRKIKRVYGSGGWSRSDFQFEIESEEEE